MSIHLLPPFRDNDPAVSKPGEWVGQSTDYIHTIASKMRAAREGAQADDMVAVPDLWAQVVAFDASLFDSKHPLHQRSVGEWRGLLTLFALAPHRTLGLTVDTLSLENLSKTPYDRSANDLREGTRPFGKLAGELKPTACLAAGQNWETIGVVRLNGKLVAMLVPSTVICPTRGYGRALDPQVVVWQHNGRLSDPCQAAGLTGVDYVLIRHFVQYIQDGINAIQSVNQQRFNGLLGLIEGFLRDLNQKQRPEISSNGLSIRSEQASYGIPAQQPLYPLFQRQFRTRVDRRFHFGLKPRPEFAHRIKGAVVIDPEMAVCLNRAPETILIWDAYSLDQVIRQPSLTGQIAEEAAKEGYLVLTPNDIFSATLRRIHGQGITSHSDNPTENRTAQRHTLPLQALMLLFLSPDEIRATLSLEDEGTTLNASLELKLVDGSSEAISRYVVAKRFDKAVVLERDQPLVLETWPNFTTDDWHYYFLFCYMPVKHHQTSLLPLATASIAAALPSPLTAKLDLTRMAANPTGVTGKNNFVDDKDLLSAIYLQDSHIEAVVWQEPTDGVFQTVISAGLILMPSPDRPIRADSTSWRIGIDFGTTNTMVYYRPEGEEPRPLAFTGRLRSPFAEVANKKIRDNFVQLHGLPEQSYPFMTAIRKHSRAQTQRSLPVWSHLVANILPAERTIGEIREKYFNNKEAPEFSLKWSIQQNHREKMQIFLSQAVLQALAEAAANGIPLQQVSLLFSFPEAFSAEQLKAFSDVVAKAVAMGRSPHLGSPFQNDITFKSESICAAHYFYTKEKAFFAGGVLTLDIGGGTTDITLWQNNKAIWGTSIKLAGQHIWINFLAQKLSFIEALLSGHEITRDIRLLYTTTSQHMPQKQAIQDALEVLVNTPLTPDSNSGIHSLWDKYGLASGNSEFKYLNFTSELALCGILFYVANVIKALAAQNIFETDRDAVQMCFGGRGSLLFERQYGNRAVAQSGSDEIRAFFKNAAGLSKNPGPFTFSDQQKHEVAFGLLDAPLPSNDTKSLDLITGECMLVGDMSIPPTFDVAKLDPSLDWRVPDLPELRRFIESYGKELGRRVAFDRNLEDLLANRVAQRVSEIRHQRATNATISTSSAVNPKARVLVMEPVFIMALRELLAHLIQDKNNSSIVAVDR